MPNVQKSVENQRYWTKEKAEDKHDKTNLPLYEKCQNMHFFSGPYSVRIQENTVQKKLRIWKFFMQCTIIFIAFEESLSLNDLL